ncbi:SDR family NAD(P)-dependent oxidoreductase [Mesobacillus selenatarsenatis]|uniref:Oxidoreductase, short chain dehydrogenase/reductase family protein n=1 Tax=Mesobacillus selenatarsenatis (strain DSM 18680 / JCM 14380 / FERM P-15431 / SF-1) TaxID=1321606 RepID=A0A0A8X8X9_MESS1|nr:SDR family oxidoreductase [Mesobacillus selenatarsenatis]GAM16363.1 oxidoreductase, short chain dehydrogenase/reductase family protein [Mesobacillus selenatarsenatis SF-1]
MKAIIVTGAGTGLGKELALLLAKQGYHLILTGRTEDNLKNVQNQIEQTGGSATDLVLDLRNLEDIKEKALLISKKYEIYGLVNNAGLGHFGPFSEVSDNEIEEMFQTNVFGTIQMTKAILPYLELNNDGLIVNIVSTAGLRGKKNEAVYCSSKFAVRGFTESLQKEYEGTGIRFVAAYMGGMNTPFWEESDHVSDPSRLRSPAEVAEIIIGNLEKDDIVIESKKS